MHKHYHRLCRMPLLAIVFAMIFMQAPARPADLKPEKSYKFIFLLKSSQGGQSASKIEALATRAMEILQKKTGIKIEPVAAQSKEEIFKKLKTGEAQIALPESFLYIEMIEKGIPVKPVVNYTLNGKQNQRMCIYVRDGSPESKEFANLRNKRLMLMRVWDWIYTQNYLKEKGAGEKITDYFSRVVKGEDDTSILYSLVFNKTDAAVMTEMAFIMTQNADKRFRAIKQMECMGDYPNGPIVFHDKVNKDDIEMLANALVKAHKDPDFKEYHAFFIAARSKFMRVTPEFYDAFHARITAARKAGWIKDFEKWQAEQK